MNPSEAKAKIAELQKLRLTKTERYVLSEVADKVLDVLQWDGEINRYRDDGDILVTLSMADYLALKRAINKL